jgi:hypothetical protein
MSMMILQETAQRFLRDRSARLSPVLVHQERNGRAARAKLMEMQEDEERARIGGRELLLVGLVAALYVAARIALTWAATAH